MKYALLFVALIMASNAQSQKNFIEPSDLEILNNTNWKGQLIYKDYQSGAWTPVDATMQVSINGRKVKTAIQYSFEPNKNRTSTVKLSKDGRYYGNEQVLSNLVLDGYRVITTTYKGKDDNRSATVFITHKFNTNTYTITKEVLYDNNNTKIVRNKYQFTKI